MAARPLREVWKRADAPPIEWWTGSVDVVHGTNFVVPPARGAARVVTVHDLTVIRFPEMCTPATLEFPALLRRALGRGAVVHAPSRFVAEEVVALLGADPSRVRAVHHGAPAGEPEAQAPPGGAGDEAGTTTPAPHPWPYVLAVGTIEPRKGYVDLVKAFDAVATEWLDLRLVIAGSKGWGGAEFDAAVGVARHRDRIIERGYVSDAERAALLSSATVFAYPSLYEGFGFPPLEAMAAGVPVVTTTAGALPEVVGGAAKLVSPGDPGALAAAISGLVGDDAARDALVAVGRRRVAELTWEQCGDGLVDLYRLAVAERGRR